MDTANKPAGSVFVSYARVDRERVRRLVDLLAAQFNVWWDEGIEPGDSWRWAIQQQLNEAACVVVVWTCASVQSQFVWTEAQPAQNLGRLVPVLLDANATVPVGFSALQHVDLTGWNGGEDNILQPFLGKVRRLVERGPAPGYGPGPLSGDTYTVPSAVSATSHLQELTAQIKSISEVLLPGSPAAGSAVAALHEVGKTYDVVNAAIDEFMDAAASPRRLRVAPYIKMERGLVEKIRAGRGHCSRILTYYGAQGGIRESVKASLPASELAKLDETFRMLGTADGDLFRALVDIGGVLSEEARAIVNLLVAGQEPAARERVLAGRAKLEPLEQQLGVAMEELQTLEEALGYAS